MPVARTGSVSNFEAKPARTADQDVLAVMRFGLSDPTGDYMGRVSM